MGSIELLDKYERLRAEHDRRVRQIIRRQRIMIAIVIMAGLFAVFAGFWI